MKASHETYPVILCGKALERTGGSDADTTAVEPSLVTMPPKAVAPCLTGCLHAFAALAACLHSCVSDEVRRA